jgi:hypothetical protein
MNLSILNKKLQNFSKTNHKDPYWICNPYLFVIKNHLNEKNKYLINNNKLFKNLIIFLKNLIINILQNFYYIIFCIFKKDNKNYLKFLDNKSNTDFLILSHLINEKHLKNKDDFYMNNFENLLRKNNVNYDLLLLNNTGKTSNELKFSNRISKTTFPLYGNIFEECYLFIKRIQFLIYSLFFFKNSFKNNFLLYLVVCFSAFHPQYRFNQLICLYLKKIFLYKKYRFILNTYEGHAIDRMIKSLCKLNNTKVLNLGYYHGSYFDNLITCKNKISNYLFPDYILVSNQDVKKIFYKKKFNVFKINKNKISVEKYLAKDKICAVLPEGVISEVLLFINNITQLAKNNLNIKFIFKLHPVLESNSEIIDKFKKLKSKNIYLTSDRNFLLKKSKWCIYRGSSSVIEYVNNGTFPFYLDLPRERNTDPLIKFGYKSKRYFKNAYQFNKIVNSNINKNLIKKLINFSTNYFYSTNDDSNKILGILK